MEDLWHIEGLKHSRMRLIIAGKRIIQAVITGELVWMLYKFYHSGRCAFIRVVQKFEEIMEDTNVTN